MRRRATSPQHARERLVRLIEIRQHRVKPEPGAVVHRRAFLLGMRVDQRRVDIDHDPLRAHTQTPTPAPERPRAQHATRQAAPARRRSCRSAETPSSLTRPARTAAPDRAPRAGQTDSRRRRRASPPDHGSPGRDHAVRGAHARPPARRELPGQPDPVSDLAKQRSARVGDQTLSVRRDIYREIAPIALHLQGEPPEQILRTSNTHRIAAQADSSAAPTTGAATASCKIRA